MDDGRIAFKIHRGPEIAQGVAPKKCFLSASDAGFGGIGISRYGGYDMLAKRIAGLALLGSIVLGPIAAIAQESHEDAKAQVEHHDRRHHTKAKIVGGSAAGGAAVGAVAGGPVGAVVGAGVGAGGGVVANKIRKHHAIKKHEEYGHPAE
jgi:hypothetical protein